jgi:hypothetical protein
VRGGQSPPVSPSSAMSAGTLAGSMSMS